MRIYTVHIKKTRRDAPDDLKAVAVKEAFAFWAFVFRWIWAAFNGMWISAAIILALELVMAVGMFAAGLDPSTAVVIGLVWAFAIGLFGRDLKRWELGVLGYELKGTVVGGNADEALRRFFELSEGYDATGDARSTPRFREDVVAPDMETSPRMTARPGDIPDNPPPGPRMGPRLT